MNRLFIGLLILLLFVSCSKNEKIEEENKTEELEVTANPEKYIIQADILNMRDNPDLSGNVIQMLTKGTIVEKIDELPEEVTIGNESGKWMRIKLEKSNEISGWVFGAFLDRYFEDNVTVESLLKNDSSTILKAKIIYNQIECKRDPFSDSTVERILNENEEYFIIDDDGKKNGWFKISTFETSPLIGWVKKNEVETYEVEKPDTIIVDRVQSITSARFYNEPFFDSSPAGGRGAGDILFKINEIEDFENPEVTWIKLFELEGPIYSPLYYYWGVAKDFKYIDTIEIFTPKIERDPDGIYFENIEKYQIGLIDINQVPPFYENPMGFGESYGIPPKNVSALFDDFWDGILVLDIEERAQNISVKMTSPTGKVYSKSLEIENGFNIITHLEDYGFENEGRPVYEIKFTNYSFLEGGIWNLEIQSDSGRDYNYNIEIEPAEFSISYQEDPNPLDTSNHMFNFPDLTNEDNIYIWGKYKPNAKYLLSINILKDNEDKEVNKFYKFDPILGDIIQTDQNGFFETIYSLEDLETGTYFPVIGDERLYLQIRNDFIIVDN